MQNTKVNLALQALCTELSGSLGATLIEINSGLSLGAFSNREGIDFNVAAAYNSEVIKQKQKTLNALGFVSEKIDEAIFTLDAQIHILKLLSPNVALYMVVDKSQGNLGMVKIVLEKHRGALLASF